jgi:hypothetical protein
VCRSNLELGPIGKRNKPGKKHQASKAREKEREMPKTVDQAQ